MCSFDEVGQPQLQMPDPTQPDALRKMKSPDQPSCSAPRLITSALLPARSSGTWDTCSSRSTRRKYGSSSADARPSSPKRLPQLSRITSGVRKHVPELI